MSIQISQQTFSSSIGDGDEKKLISQIIKQQIINTIKASKFQLLCHKTLILNKTDHTRQTIQSNCLSDSCYIDVDTDEAHNNQWVGNLKEFTCENNEVRSKQLEQGMKKQAA